MSEELTKVKHAEKADELANYKQITLDGDVTGEIEAKQDGTQGFNGSENVKITTTITGGDISNTTIEITELSGVDEEEIQSKEITGKLLYKIKNKFEEIEKGLENKLDKTATATSAEKLSKEKNISLVGNVKGTVVFDGSKDVEIQTEIVGGDIKDTTVSFTELQTNEEINSGDNTGIIVGKIKKNLSEIENHLNIKLDETGNAVSASNADMLDGQHGSYYAPIENPIFSGDVKSDRFINNKMGFTTKNYYEIDLRDSSRFDENTWYPIMIDSNIFECDCEIHSQPYNGDNKYNQNSIHFLLQYYGWTDTPRRFVILNYGCYEPEYTIGYIVCGGRQGNKAVYVRGGRVYYFLTNAVPSLKEKKYIYHEEIYEPSKKFGEGFTNAYLVWKYTDTPSSYQDFQYGISKFSNIYGTKGIFSEDISVPTPAVTDNSTKVATTEYVRNMFKAYKEGRLNL